MSSQPWISRAGVAWALFRAPDVPERLVSTLIAVAAYSDEDGTGSYPSAQTIADCTRKTRRQARRDLDALEKLGLLRPGNWRLAAHLRADRRPKVYDLAMCDDPPPTGGRKRTRGDTDDPSYGRTPTTPRRRPRGDTQGRTGGHTGSNEGSPVTPKEFLKNSRTARADARPAAASDTPEITEAIQLLREHGHNEQQARLIVEFYGRPIGSGIDPLNPAEILKDVQYAVGFPMRHEEGTLVDLDRAMSWDEHGRGVEEFRH